MSDLTGKFGGFEDQIANNHTEVMNALDTIATALGAPPPGPTTTLADVITALTQTNTILNGIRTDMNGYLLEIFNTVDTINNNASLNAQRLLTLMLQTACPCDTTTPLLPPDLITDPTELENDAKCQRIQLFLDIWRSWSISLGVYLNNHGSISSFQIQNLLDITLGDVGVTGSELNVMSTSTRDNLSQFLNTAGTPSAINAAIFDGMNDPALFEALRPGLYGATNASAGKDAADAAIAAAGVAYPGIFSALFYTSWPNVMYSTTPVVDASAYDGTLCAGPISPIDPGENCLFVTSVYPVTTSDGQTLNAVVWPNNGTNILPASVRPPGYPDIVASAAIWYNGSDLLGYWIRGTDGAGGAASGRAYLVADGSYSIIFNGSYQQIAVHINYVAVLGDLAPVFTFEICVEEPL